MKKYLLFFAVVFLFQFFWYPANAQEAPSGLIVSPTIIDEKTKAKDIFNYEIKFKNGTGNKISIYTLVDDITAEAGEVEYDGPGSADPKDSLASWITFRRAAIELEPGEEKTQDLEINVSTYAVPGKRYAQLVFAYGSDRTDAQIKRKTVNFPKTMISLDVQDEIVEKAQLIGFSADKKIFFKLPAGLSFTVKNNGNSEIEPIGSIFIYNRRGAEVAKLDANPDAGKIKAGEELAFSRSWTEGGYLGKFKAKIEMEYGAKDRRDLQDTIFFWVFPIKILIAFAAGFAILFITLSILIFKKTYRPGAAQREEFAAPKREREGVIDLKNGK
jgi:hypothetical protein